ncbi:MAG: UvrD-helicase domain-containing protein [Thermales bacterium]|nr:UvrD-helicase domain-containing protein [Thermales bacterium]
MSTNILNSLEKISSQLKTQQKLDAKPFYEFRNNYLKKNSQGEYVLIDLKNLKNNYELAKIYDDYKKALYKEGLFDFDDMLIEVNKSLQENPELSYNYKEKYLYILVDEFQDTNLSQSQLLDNLIDLEVTNNYPNIMVVGDDDQAIYKFQGANIENILNFQEKIHQHQVYYPTSELQIPSKNP